MKLIATILTLFTLSANAQDSLFWSRPAYTTCFVQQSPDNYTWKTISEVQMADTNYTAPIPGATYYYRVLAGQDTSVCIYVYDSTTTVTIDTTTATTDTTTTVIIHGKSGQSHGHNKRLAIQVAGSNALIESPKDQPCEVRIYDMSGRLMKVSKTYLTIGLNKYWLGLAHGVYILNIKTSQESQSKKFYYDGR
jgi:hypothetical protein